MDSKKIIKKMLWFGLLLSLVFSLFKVWKGFPEFYNRINGLSINSGGDTIAIFADEEKDYILNLDEGLFTKRIYERKKKRGLYYETIQAMAQDEKQVYLLINQVNSKDYSKTQTLVSIDLANFWLAREKERLKLSNQRDYKNFEWIETKEGKVLQLLGVQTREKNNVVEERYVLGEKGELSLTEEQYYKLPEDRQKDRGIYQLFSSEKAVGYIALDGKLYLSNEKKEFEACYLTGLDVKNAGILRIIKDSHNNCYAIEQGTGNVRSLNFDKGSSKLVMLGEDYVGEKTGIHLEEVYYLALVDPQNYVAVAQKNNRERLILVNEKEECLSDGISQTYENRINYMVKYFLIYYVLYIGIAMLIYIAFSLIKNTEYIRIKVALVIGLLLLGIVLLVGQLVKSNYTQLFEKDMKEDLQTKYQLYIKNIISGEANQLYEANLDPKSLYYKMYTLLSQPYSEGRAVWVDEAYRARIDSKVPQYYNLKYFVSKEELAAYEEAFEKEVVIKKSFDGSYEYMSLYGVIPSNKGRALLCLNTNLMSITAELDKLNNQTNIVMLLVGLGSLGILIVIIKLIFRPVYDIEKSLGQISETKTTHPIKYYSKDEFYRISKLINTLAEELQMQAYRIASSNESYFKFISRLTFKALEKSNIGEIKLGDRRELVGPMSLLMTAYTLEDNWQVEERISDINDIFNVLHEVSLNYDGLMNCDNREGFLFSTFYLENATSSLEASQVVLRQLNELRKALNYTLLLDYGESLLNLGGTEERLLPLTFSKRLNDLALQLPMLQKSGCRLLVTGELLNELESKGNNLYRYIGFLLDQEGHKISLYDMYGQEEEEMKNAKEDTKLLFEEALNSFYNKDFYKAQNLFASIIRENPRDEVARWYVFRSKTLEEQEMDEKGLSLVSY